ncbi:hypothetical protein RND81_08G030000 [Saponaria officinalis]|uniref:Strictosidine synthase conserved region domain-containing protein n=1 Tax=Saponaria officinalis TaxID=3572 RepID=A0AAW1J2Z3_SAPOF
MNSIQFVVFFFIGCFVALALQVYYYSPISPDLLHLPTPSLTHSLFPTNTYLQEVTKIGEGRLKDPEDVSVDKEGILYTATRDGWIKRLHKNGSLEDWKWVENGSLLGLTTLATGGIAVCDSELGLLRVTEDGVTALATQFNKSDIKFADDVIEAKDGSLYFSVPSTKYMLHEWHLDMLEAKPHGQLLKYNPSANEVSLVLDNLCFPNGVAVSEEQDYLLVCETWKFRCLKHWLAGDLQGKTEVFIDNLPDGPDNINLAPDGSYWIALVQLTDKRFDFVHTSKIAKHLIATFPGILDIMQAFNKKATVMRVSADGKVLEKYDDPEGKVVNFVTSAVEYEGNLYLGSLKADFVGKLPLPNNKS